MSPGDPPLQQAAPHPGHGNCCWILCQWCTSVNLICSFALAKWIGGMGWGSSAADSPGGISSENGELLHFGSSDRKEHNVHLGIPVLLFHLNCLLEMALVGGYVKTETCKNASQYAHTHRGDLGGWCLDSVVFILKFGRTAADSVWGWCEILCCYPSRAVKVSWAPWFAATDILCLPCYRLGIPDFISLVFLTWFLYLIALVPFHWTLHPHPFVP